MAKKKQDMSVEAVVKRAQKNVAHKAPKSKIQVVLVKPDWYGYFARAVLVNAIAVVSVSVGAHYAKQYMAANNASKKGRK